jgi:SAM-dependent methyltransferase
LRLYGRADALNRRNIQELVTDRPYATICDLGCDEGEWTGELARFSQAHQVYGVEVVFERARRARLRGIQVTVSDLSVGFPFRDESFDLVHANQVIEHVSDVDGFLAETNRVLRLGGVAVISTENGSSWHNIFAAAMGWQIFSLTNMSRLMSGVGNPLALHRGGQQTLQSWRHRTIFNYRGLVEILAVHGLTPIRILGAGYYPLPAHMGRVDARHSHFVTVKAVKVTSSRGAE